MREKEFPTAAVVNKANIFYQVQPIRTREKLMFLHCSEILLTFWNIYKYDGISFSPMCEINFGSYFPVNIRVTFQKNVTCFSTALRI